MSIDTHPPLVDIDRFATFRGGGFLINTYSQVEKSRSWLVVVRLRKDVLVVKVN